MSRHELVTAGQHLHGPLRLRLELRLHRRAGLGQAEGPGHVHHGHVGVRGPPAPVLLQEDDNIFDSIPYLHVCQHTTTQLNS